MNWFTHTINRLTAHFDNVMVHPRANDRLLAELRARFPELPAEVEHFYSQCNGVCVGLRAPEEGSLFSLDGSLERMPIAGDGEPAVRFLPLRSDGCGSYDCLVLGDGIALGAVVFWDHEVYEGPAYLLGGTFRSYFEIWGDHLVHRYLPDGTEDGRYVAPNLDQWPWYGEPERAHPWPFDESWMRSKDPVAARMLDDPQVRAWLLRQES